MPIQILYLNLYSILFFFVAKLRFMFQLSESVLKIQDKLYEEIMTQLGESDEIENNFQFSTLPLLQQCIRETHRVYPLLGTAMTMMKIAETDMEICGYEIPKGSILLNTIFL